MSATEKIEDGGPAYPSALAIGPSGDVYGSAYYSDGMSLRDYFAGQALAGLMAKHDCNNEEGWAWAAHAAFEVSDAMLTARKSPVTGNGDE